MTVRLALSAALLLLFLLHLPSGLQAQNPPPAGGPVPGAAAPAPAVAPTPAPAPAVATAPKLSPEKVAQSEAAARELIGSGPAPAGEKDEPFLQGLFKQMGWLAYPFAVLSVITMSLVFLQLFTLHRRAVASDKFMNTADNLIRNRDFLGLLTFCNRRNEMIAHVTRKAIDFATRNPTARFEEVRDVAEAEGNRQSNLLMQRVSYLADIGSLAPLLGLMGTVIGLIASFHAIASENYAGAQQIAVAKGVGQALMTTASGLAIAIPAVLFYAMFRARANTLVAELESACTHIMAVLAAQYERPATRQRRPNT